jgi:hypothetical protein
MGPRRCSGLWGSCRDLFCPPRDALVVKVTGEYDQLSPDLPSQFALRSNRGRSRAGGLPWV